MRTVPGVRDNGILAMIAAGPLGSRPLDIAQRVMSADEFAFPVVVGACLAVALRTGSRDIHHQLSHSSVDAYGPAQGHALRLNQEGSEKTRGGASPGCND